MDIRRLSYFTQIAELGSLNVTAERVNLSQPSLSRQIRLLEEELGVDLFTRHRSGMQLTREGEELRMRIAGPLRQLELALQDTKSLASYAGGSVALGMPATAISALASPLVRRVAAAAPQISLHIVEGYAGHLLSSLERGEIDIAVVDGPRQSDSRIAFEDLAIERMMLVGPPDSPISPDEPVDFGTLVRLPLILPRPINQPLSIRDVVEKIAAVSDAKVNFPLHADSVHLVKSYVEAGLGYSLLTYSSFSREAESGRLRFAPLCDPEIFRHMMLATNSGGQYPRATSTVKRLIHEEMEALGQHMKVPSAPRAEARRT